MVHFMPNKLANALSYSDLIRHGKNAQPSQPTSNQPASNTSSSNKKHSEVQNYGQSGKQQNTNAMHNSYPPAVGVPSKGLAVERECFWLHSRNSDRPLNLLVSVIAQPTTAPMVSPDYQREAEQIVREEREQKERMPVYKV